MGAADERWTGGGGVQPAGAGGYRPALAVMGMVCAGFWRSSCSPPACSARTPPAFPGPESAAAGPGLIFHPPLLYMGYVGFRWPSLAIAALLSGRLDSAFTRLPARGRWRRGCS
ncbi:hypothetical protein KCP70_11285 [Salmonella enterica subsp. enterica]|nr:hypothetical protein KCP70_11285 [Salmonella enterica subsp. enterica]